MHENIFALCVPQLDDPANPQAVAQWSGVSVAVSGVNYRLNRETQMKRLVIILLGLSFVIGAMGCSGEPTSKPSSRPTAVQPQTALIDINRADKEELMTLKGIGEARAGAIIQARPFGRKDELVQKGIVPATVYDNIKDRIIARQK